MQALWNDVFFQIVLKRQTFIKRETLNSKLISLSMKDNDYIKVEQIKHNTEPIISLLKHVETSS